VFRERVCAGGEDILLSEGDGKSESKKMAVRLREEKRARAGSRNSTQESLGFNKNIKKSGFLIIGERGLILVFILYIIIILARYILLI
jgi:hypothetical protein